MRWFLILVLLVACGDDRALGPVDAPQLDAPPEIDAPQIDAPPMIDAPLVIDAPTPIDAMAVDARPFRSCTGSSQCLPDEWCPYGIPSYCQYFTQGYCQINGTTACPTPMPGARPVCACDGMPYPDACHARLAGTMPGSGACPLVDDLYPCGDRYCQLDTEYCAELRENTDVPRRLFECRPRPAVSNVCAALLAMPCAGNQFPWPPGGAPPTCTVNGGRVHYTCITIPF